jgi:ABC-2 type transport system permease protein
MASPEPSTPAAAETASTETPGRKGFFAVVWREIKRYVSRPIYVMVTLVLPLTVATILVSMFYSGLPRDLPIAVCDHDNSSLSRKMVRILDANASMKVAFHVTDEQEGLRLIRSGRAYSLVVIPANMQGDIMAQRAPKVAGYYNTQYLMSGSVIGRDVNTVVSTLSAGVNLKGRQKRGELQQTAMARIVPIQLDSHSINNAYTNYAYNLVPALLPTMLQIFILLTTVFAIGIELKEGTAGKWLATAKGSVIIAIAGKLIPYSCIFLLLGLLMDRIMFDFLGIPLRGDRMATLGAYVLFMLAYQSLGTLFICLTSSMRLAISLSALYSSPAFAFAGITFPFLGMPWPAQWWGGLLPLSYYLRILQDQIQRGSPLYTAEFQVLALLMFILLAPALTPFRFREILAKPEYWGRT